MNDKIAVLFRATRQKDPRGGLIGAVTWRPYFVGDLTVPAPHSNYAIVETIHGTVPIYDERIKAADAERCRPGDAEIVACYELRTSRWNNGPSGYAVLKTAYVHGDVVKGTFRYTAGGRRTHTNDVPPYDTDRYQIEREIPATNG
jgi:hypothetical protein